MKPLVCAAMNKRLQLSLLLAQFERLPHAQIDHYIL